MVYADYTYYKETYLGKLIPEDEFPMLAKRASEYLDYITVGRAAENASLPALQDACCALAEQYKVIEKAQESVLSETGEKSSETVGSYSVSYRSSAELAKNSTEEMSFIVSRYLGRTGLLYRGGRCFPCTPHIL